MNRDNSKKKKIPDKKLIVLSIGFSITIVFSLIVYRTFFQTQESKFSLNAVIVDQLSEHFPNPTFKENATNLLMQAGFSVSYFESKDVNVTFYRDLCKGAYGIIILRAHSALRANETIVDLFTSEPYDQSKYLDYRNNGFLSKAEYLVPLGQQTERFYFAITPKFIENFGNFPKSIIVAMGCSSLNYSGTAQTFINKGAKAYVGWTDIVLYNDTDYETTRFLEMFLTYNKTLSNSIATTGTHIYHVGGKTISSRMDFYPQSVENLRLSDLIAEAEGSKTSTAFNNLEQSFFLIANVNFKRFLTE